MEVVGPDLTRYLQRGSVRFCPSTCRVRVNLVLIVAEELLLSVCTNTKCCCTH